MTTVRFPNGIKYDVLVRDEHLTIFKTPKEWWHSYNGFKYRANLRIEDGKLTVASLSPQRPSDFPTNRWTQEILEDFPKWWERYKKIHPMWNKVGKATTNLRDRTNRIANLQKQISMMRGCIDTIEQELIQLQNA